LSGRWSRQYLDSLLLASGSHEIGQNSPSLSLRIDVKYRTWRQRLHRHDWSAEGPERFRRFAQSLLAARRQGRQLVVNNQLGQLVWWQEAQPIFSPQRGRRRAPLDLDFDRERPRLRSHGISKNFGDQTREQQR
jgi:hypothetical protein